MIAHGVPGIDIRQEHALPARPERVFAALTDQIDHWWPSGSRLLGPDSHLRLAPRLGECLAETGARGAGAIWGQIDLIEPDRRLCLSGWFGVPGLVMGRVQFELADQGEGCLLTLTHQGIGPVPEDRVGRQRGLWRDVLGGALRAHLMGIAV